jgi:hypothetical protein
MIDFGRMVSSGFESFERWLAPAVACRRCR